MAQLFTGPDGQSRCAWCASDPEYMRYHDEEWGYPVSDDIRLFEKICLEGFQSGLSWWTILRKRAAFRAAFAGFDFHKVAQFGEADVTRLLADAGILRFFNVVLLGGAQVAQLFFHGALFRTGG